MTRDEKLEQIAQGCLGTNLKCGDTLLEQWRFKCTTVHITPVDLKQALQLAYIAGRDSVSHTDASEEDNHAT